MPNTKELYQKLLAAKKAENKAKEKRLQIEAQFEIPEFEGGSKLLRDQGYKIKYDKNETYSFDQERWIETRKEMPNDLRPEKIKFEVDKAGLEFLKKEHPLLYKKVSDTITMKTGKVSIKVEKE